MFVSSQKTQKLKSGLEIPIMQIKGKDYLQVQWRLVWFREERPNFGIETESVAMGPTSATFKATIKDESGRIVATAHKSEDKQGFSDFMEKAETGAIGRALALIGYGTQFCGDELDEGARIVDAPAGRPNNGLGIFPEDPGEGNGERDDRYVIPGGEYARKTLEQVGPTKLKVYIAKIEAKAEKAGQPISDVWKDFINRAEEYIGTLENIPLDDPAKAREIIKAIQQNGGDTSV